MDYEYDSDATYDEYESETTDDEHYPDPTDDSVSPSGLVPECPVCFSRSQVLLCDGCKAVSYCSTAHRFTHQPTHKAVCITIKRSREVLEREEADLRAHPGDVMLPVDVFNTAVGKFWGIYGTRDYMRARFEAVDALLRLDTVAAVEQAVEHLTDMLRLNRSDNMGLRDIVPNLLLRLDREQDCYDFLKWWANFDNDGGYDWTDVTLPYLNIRDADAFEPINALSLRQLSLSQLVALTLLKLRLFLDLSAFENREFSFMSRPDPDGDRPTGRLVRAKMRTLNGARFSAAMAAVKDQYKKLCRLVHDANPHFWGALVDETNETLARPLSFEGGSVEEADLALYYCQRAWDESEDAILMVQSDTLEFVSVYQGPAVVASASVVPLRDPETRTENVEKRRGTGEAFPSVFKPTFSPAKLFPPSEVGRDGSIRFVCHNDPKTVLVYVDGACSNNGQPGSRAGWAVVYGPPDLAPVSGRLEDKGPFGDDSVATSNRAELRAAIAALRLGDWRGDGFDRVVIATDSSYVVDGATGWVRGWVRKGWKTRTGGDVKNKDLWELLLGEIERWDGHGLRVELWKIPRELNDDADGAAKRAIDDGPAEAEFRDITIASYQAATTTTAGNDDASRILVLCLNYKEIFVDVFRSFLSSITARAAMEWARTPAAALALLNRQPPPSVILVADAAVARQRKMLERVIDLLRGGATVVLAGCFSSMASPGQLNRLFATMGLPWERGWYERKTVSLNRDAVGGRRASRLPSAYSQKAVFLKNVDRSAAWYTAGGAAGQAAVVFAKVGSGRLGYVGDVNGEEGSDAVVLAMCGLLD